MAYATVEDLESRFGSEIDELGAGPAEVAAALDDAAATIDARLSVAYDLPLPAPLTQYPLLMQIAVDLARLRLYTDDPTKAAIKRAEDGERRLDQVIDGKREIVGSTSGRIARRQTASLSAYVDTSAGGGRDVRRDAADTARLF